MRKGAPSVNPSGKRNDSAHEDGWFSMLTGVGTLAHDKREQHDFQADTIDYETAVNLWRGDDIAARAVDKPVDDMTRAGFDFLIADEDESKEAQEALEDEWERLDAINAMHEALSFERAYGGSAILLGVRDFETNLREPLSIDRVKSVDFLTVLERRELIPMLYYANPRAPKYGLPAVYQLAPVSPGSDVEQSGAAFETIMIHETRLLVFPGIRVTRQNLTGTDGWGDSIFTRMWRVLRDFNAAWDGTGLLLQDFAQAVFKMKNLAAMLAQDGNKLFADRMKAMDLGRSIVRAIVIDADEEFERKTTPVTGLADLLQEYMVRMSVAADMPVTVLFGISPGGLNATGESDIKLWDDRIAAWQKKKIIPHLKRLTELLLAANNNSPEKWSIKARPLRQPDEKVIAETRKLVAETDEIYLIHSVVSADEIAMSRYGGDVYSMETVIDFDDREALELQIEKEEKEAEAATLALNAAPKPGAEPVPGGDDA